MSATLLDAVADPLRLQIAKALLAAPSVTTAELARHCDASLRTVHRYLATLAGQGLLVRLEPMVRRQAIGRPADRYCLTPDAREGLTQLFATVGAIPIGNPAKQESKSRLYFGL